LDLGLRVTWIGPEGVKSIILTLSESFPLA
jgi:hypothetical protein